MSARASNEKWAADTTYVPTHEGWLYLVSVLDLFSQQIVGWAMGEQHDADLAVHSAGHGDPGRVRGSG